jgi:hypothetical protein
VVQFHAYLRIAYLIRLVLAAAFVKVSTSENHR